VAVLDGGPPVEMPRDGAVHNEPERRETKERQPGEAIRCPYDQEGDE
jgi:hypothetical protein